jgi:hypothetical protein
MNGPAPARANDHVFLRALLLLLWIALVNLWLKRHVGFGWDDPGAISIIVAAAGTVLYVLEKAGRKEPEAWWANLFSWLDLPLLLLLFVAVAIPMSLFSSVSVLNDPLGSALSASLAHADQQVGQPKKLDNLSDPSKGVQFTWVSTSPLGRPYRLSVAGYLPQTVQVFPLWGLTVSPRRDLRPSLSGLFRPGADGLRTLADGGCFIAWREQGKQRIKIASGKPDRKASLLVGNEQPISPALFENWRMELAAQQLTSDAIDARILIWKLPYQLSSAIPLEPQTTLVAEVQTREGAPMMRARVTLGEDRLTDVPMEAVTDDAAPPHPSPEPGCGAADLKGVSR